jgi:hypothetical protein
MVPKKSGSTTDVGTVVVGRMATVESRVVRAMKGAARVSLSEKDTVGGAIIGQMEMVKVMVVTVHRHRMTGMMMAGLQVSLTQHLIRPKATARNINIAAADIAGARITKAIRTGKVATPKPTVRRGTVEDDTEAARMKGRKRLHPWRNKIKLVH